MSDPTSRRKPASLLRLMLPLLAVGAAGGLLGTIAVRSGLGSEMTVFSLVSLIAAVAALWLIQRWWVAVDEAVREAHKTGWFWGGSVGILLVSVTAAPLAVIAKSDTAQLGLNPEQAGSMLVGIVFTLTVLTACYFVWWVGWWFTRGR